MEKARAVPELLHELTLGLHESMTSTTNTAKRQNNAIAKWILYNAGRLTGPSHTPRGRKQTPRSVTHVRVEIPLLSLSKLMRSAKSTS